MKPGPESTAAQRALEKDEFVSRKLIRPTLPMPEPKQDGGGNGAQVVERQRSERAASGAQEFCARADVCREFLFPEATAEQDATDRSAEEWR